MTDYTLIKTETLRQVLDALNSTHPDRDDRVYYAKLALTTLLAEPCEPVGYATYCGEQLSALLTFKPDLRGSHPSWQYREIYAAPKEPT